MNKLKLVWLVLLIICCVGSVFAQEDKKNLYGILMDNTGSMRSQLRKIKEIGKELTKTLTEKGQVSIFNFQTVSNSKVPLSELKEGLMWGQDKNILFQYIDSIEAVGGQTTLFDAIFLASNLTKSKFEKEKESISEKILILVSDGEDRASNIKPKDLIKFAKENEIKLYAIGLVEELGSEGGFIGLSPQAKAKDFLNKITKETNGRAIFPKSKHKADEIVKNLFTENKKN